MIDQPTDSDTLRDEDEPKSSARVLDAIRKAERDMLAWQDTCDKIDDIYSRQGDRTDGDWLDPDYDLFWASMEVLKPAVYASPPVPVVTTKFKDRNSVKNVASEMIERASIAAFDAGGIDEVMLCVRDDLILYNRGQIWLTYETDDGQRLCYEHIDRKDFGHEPARKWADVGFVWRRAWMTAEEMRKRFAKHSGDAYLDAKPAARAHGVDRDAEGLTGKVGVYEVWHKHDNRVYWVADGVSVLLDSSAPHLKLRGFFPCPRPAYGTLRPRTLEPVPDYKRYAAHFAKINRLTKRIYLLLDRVKMKGLIPAGGDIGDAVELAMERDDDELLIPVPAAAMMDKAATGFVAWLPIAEVASAITGLIEAREKLIQDFYQLSGISDIMRGATEAQETLGAQRLKSQFGSVRVREKVDELQRIARDVTQIAAEIMAEHFSRDTLLDMAQMELPTRAEIKQEIREIEDAAEAEMKALGEQVQKQAQQQGQQPQDPQSMQQQLQQSQQQIAAKYAEQLKRAESKVAIEDVMDLLRDDKARGFAFEIATDSTIMTDETQEKQSRSEFLQAFMGAGSQVIEFAQLGPEAANLSGGILQFVLQPYRVGRQLDTLIDEFVDAAPRMAQEAQQAKQGEGGDEQGTMALAQAEMAKAQAQSAKVQADAQLKQQEIQLRASEAQAKEKADQQRFMLEVQQSVGSIKETAARTEKIYAEIQKLGVDAEDSARTQDRDDAKAAADIEAGQVDQALAVHDRQRAAADSARNAMMSDRQQTFAEQQAAQGGQDG